MNEDAVVNLEGGIFHWHNQRRPLQSNGGSTHFVHPYNDHWGQLITRRHLLRYELS